ncbi:hypothetical protein DBZ36_00705 [Alginatibacterium sediminis]|uniref:DNA topoisomerase type IA zn finger domain-containing protein n=1 Tax=Alginatibacterium sediminis TaxID=2164068 RepID=A0A420ENA3_9ALTE|nr:type I DNA topoisomerase [Alginatibacterium sediminis]RKF22199.1 hypothetical protein DBZ36_00705 [Alginatibacterium sediminis]
MSKDDKPLFSAHEHALEQAFDTCPKCGQPLVHRSGKSGAFLGCSAYPSCDYIRSSHPHDSSVEKVLEGSECPKCKSELMIRQGRYGMFIACSNFPECHHIESQQSQTNTTAEPTCPSCGKGKLVSRNSRFGKTFYACDGYPKCKYALNDKPIEQACPECDWPLLIEKKTAQGRRLQCAQKNCAYKGPILD